MHSQNKFLKEGANIRREAIKNADIKYPHLCFIHFHHGYKLNNTRISLGSYLLLIGRQTHR